MKTTLISPHPDFVSDDLPEIRIVTTHSPKIARSLNLISNEQRISLLAINENSAVQVRTGCCYRIAAKIINLNRIEGSSYYFLLIRYYNLEIVLDGTVAFFTSFDRDSESDHPFMLVLTDRKIKFINSQLFLLNTRLIFGRTEKGKFLNNLMRTRNYIFVLGLDNVSQIKTIKVSP